MAGGGRGKRGRLTSKSGWRLARRDMAGGGGGSWKLESGLGEITASEQQAGAALAAGCDATTNTPQ